MSAQLTQVRAIETRYNGYRFRSRLEARWAVFFDALGVPYEYEKEGFDLDGEWYLPDFWMPKQDCWIEIKGQPPTEEERRKALKLAAGSGKFVYLFYHTPGPGRIIAKDIGLDGPHIDVLDYGLYFSPDGEDWDGGIEWGQCIECGAVRIGFHGGDSKCFGKGDAHIQPACNCRWSPGWDRTLGLMKAYEASRQARFER